MPRPSTFPADPEKQLAIKVKVCQRCAGLKDSHGLSVVICEICHYCRLAMELVIVLVLPLVSAVGVAHF